MHTPVSWVVIRTGTARHHQALVATAHPGAGSIVAVVMNADDAPLLAAAPALQAALARCVFQLETLDNTIPCLEDARGALAAARRVTR